MQGASSRGLLLWQGSDVSDAASAKYKGMQGNMEHWFQAAAAMSLGLLVEVHLVANICSYVAGSRVERWLQLVQAKVHNLCVAV